MINGELIVDNFAGGPAAEPVQELKWQPVSV